MCNIFLHKVAEFVIYTAGIKVKYHLTFNHFQMFNQRLKTKDVNNGSYSCFVRCATLLFTGDECLDQKTGAIHYIVQLVLPDKGHSITLSQGGLSKERLTI